MLVYHCSSSVVEQHDQLISKPVSHWTTEEVVSWLEHLGPWAQLYREPFRQENVNGRYAFYPEVRFYTFYPAKSRSSCEKAVSKLQDVLLILRLISVLQAPVDARG